MNTAPMSIGAAKQERDAIRARHFEIEARLAEMKRLYVVDRINQDFAERCALEAELAGLRVRKNQVDLVLHAAKKAEAAYKRASFTAILVKMLHDAGLAEMVKQADRQALDEMVALGMTAPE
jgi:hypothetical protein